MTFPDFVRSLGVDEVIDYNATVFGKVVKGVDAVVDTVGDVSERSWQVLRPDGILVTFAVCLDAEAGMARELSQSRHGRGRIVLLTG